ncbi:MAG: phosphoribosylanthranilate isomerase [Candidatus Sulfotelmatobacter sp.]
MTWIKICGMTNLEDALTAAEAGADAVGFVFYEKSPRNIGQEAAREIVEKLPEAVEKIGVSVNGSGVEPCHLVPEVGLTGWQSYEFVAGEAPRGGREAMALGCFPKSPRFLMSLRMNHLAEGEKRILKLVADFARLRKNLPEEAPVLTGWLGTIVLDSGDLRQPGGTGKTFDWKKAVPIAQEMRRGGINLVVAGGLTPENVGEAMQILKPWGVDVVSGVEARPGKKDPQKVRAFVRVVREIDR